MNPASNALIEGFSALHQEIKRLRAELQVRTLLTVCCEIPEHYRWQARAYESGYVHAWRGQPRRCHYSTLAHTSAYAAGHRQGKADSAEEIAKGTI